MGAATSTARFVLDPQHGTEVCDLGYGMLFSFGSRLRSCQRRGNEAGFQLPASCVNSQL
jgi:hypothetical protein